MMAIWLMNQVEEVFALFAEREASPETSILLKVEGWLGKRGGGAS